MLTFGQPKLFVNCGDDAVKVFGESDIKKYLHRKIPATDFRFVEFATCIIGLYRGRKLGDSLDWFVDARMFCFCFYGF